MTTDTTALRGLALLDAAIARIEAHPESWTQEDFRCGSGMCIGGWICELAGGKWLTPDLGSPYAWMLVPEEDDPQHIIITARSPAGERVPAVTASERAMRLIGAPRRFMDLDLVHEERVLFDGGNELADIREIRDDIAAWFESQATS